MNESEYLKSRLDDQYGWFEGKSAWNKQRYYTFQIIQIVAGALIPLLTAMSRYSPMIYVVGTLGVVVTVVGGILSLFKFHEQWIEYRTAAEALKQEKFLYETGSGPYAVSNRLQVLVERVEAILGRQNSLWVAASQPKAGPAPRTAAG